MRESETSPFDQNRTRRNLMAAAAKLGGVTAAAIVVAVKPARAVSAITCLLKGTVIRTSEGPRKVEDLVVGDLLPTLSGRERAVQWVGRYPYKKKDAGKAWSKDARPVRIARSALAPNVPSADLYVTKGHALFMDGVLVSAGSLVNGTSITLDAARQFDELVYYHIKLESHDIIFAEGAPVETLLTVDENAVNFADYLRRYGAPTVEDAPCAPLLSFNGGRSEIKSRLRSAISPWIDRRQPLDVIRDRLEDRGVALSRKPEMAL